MDQIFVATHLRVWNIYMKQLSVLNNKCTVLSFLFCNFAMAEVASLRLYQCAVCSRVNKSTST